jgi:DNA polymerase-4
VLARFARDVERDIGMFGPGGSSGNKFPAKIASDLDKPVALPRSTRTRRADAGRAAGRFIYGVGPASQEGLVQRGFASSPICSALTSMS